MKYRLVLCANIIIILLSFSMGTCLAAGELRDVDIINKNGRQTVLVKYSGDIEIKTEQYEKKLVLFLLDCTAAPGSREKPGNGSIIKRVRWNYKAEKKSTWVVIELNNKAEAGIAKTANQIRIDFSDKKSPGAQNQNEAQFKYEKKPIPPAVKELMNKYTWREGCPLPQSKLVYVNVSYWGFDGAPHKGELIVHEKLADDIIGIFKELFDSRFPIEKMKIIEHYQGDDNLSMADNNTSAFNCRFVSGTKKFSKHSYGAAIDINPLINPFVKGDRVSPAGGKKYLDRTKAAPGLITKDGPCYKAFTKRGWTWGGNWKTMKDYQHFEKMP